LHLECSPLILLCIAWDDPVKGVDLLLGSLGIIAGRFPSAKFWVAGSASNNRKYTDLACELGIEDQVVWLGIRSDVPILMDCCDIYVQPSRAEGFGLTVAEAMASGKPVAAFRVGGIPEVVEDGVTGILAQPESTASLGEALTRLLEDPELRQKMGAAGRERVAHFFDLDKQVARIIDWYEKPV
ncbi:MAG: glycosyltransferase family 4 protein, partial [Candidatus Omnitrophica bacterium]|nr:glycosyltransferase family 4 protein [Candidatus Omnitrophota bacterium]